MKKTDIVKKIQQAEAERKRLTDGVKTQKETAMKRQEDLSSRLQTMDPAASYEDFKQIQQEAATNEAFLSHLEYAEKQLKEPTDAGKAEYKSIIAALQADTDAAHKAAGAEIMKHLNAITAIIDETAKADDDTRELVKKARNAYATQKEGKTVHYSEQGPDYSIKALSRLSSLIRAKQQIEDEQKKGKPF